VSCCCCLLALGRLGLQLLCRHQLLRPNQSSNSEPRRPLGRKAYQCLQRSIAVSRACHCSVLRQRWPWPPQACIHIIHRAGGCDLSACWPPSPGAPVT
jgi:hypothetical protein